MTWGVSSVSLGVAEQAWCVTTLEALGVRTAEALVELDLNSEAVRTAFARRFKERKFLKEVIAPVRNRLSALQANDENLLHFLSQIPRIDRNKVAHFQRKLNEIGIDSWKVLNHEDEDELEEIGHCIGDMDAARLIYAEVREMRNFSVSSLASELKDCRPTSLSARSKRSVSCTIVCSVHTND